MNDHKLTEDEQEFLHMMYEEEFDFEKWADGIDIAIENGEISTEPAKSNKEIDIDFDLDDLF